MFVTSVKTLDQGLIPELTVSEGISHLNNVVSLLSALVSSQLKHFYLISLLKNPRVSGFILFIHPYQQRA